MSDHEFQRIEHELIDVRARLKTVEDRRDQEIVDQLKAMNESLALIAVNTTPKPEPPKVVGIKVEPGAPTTH